MAVVDVLLNLSSAFGLSGAAGLNAYIPLLTVAVLQNRGMLHLPPPYDVLGAWWCIVLLLVLLAVEIVVDKVPGADHVNDMIQTLIRPTAGALLFAAQMDGTLTHSIHPGVWIAIGLLMSGGVHAAKSLARPVVNASTVGLGAPLVSLVEDLVSTTLSIVALLVPILCLVLLVVFGWLLYRMLRRFRGVRRRRAVEVTAVAVGRTGTDAPWGGGV